MGLCVLLVLPLAAVAEIDHGPRRYAFDDSDRLTAAQDFEPWANMMSRRAAEPFSIDGCMANESACTRTMRGARTVILRGRALALPAQLQLVNRFVNRRGYLRAVTDSHWQSPVTFLRLGGDCEDYAVAKYFILKAMGVSAADMRVVVARTAGRPGHHALLAVRAAGDVLFLDLDNRILDGSRYTGYQYLYSVNEDSLWDHAGGQLPKAS